MRNVLRIWEYINNFRLRFLKIDEFEAKHLCSARNATLNPALVHESL